MHGMHHASHMACTTQKDMHEINKDQRQEELTCRLREEVVGKGVRLQRAELR